MSKVLTDNQYYGQIADIIREQNGTSNTYTPSQMVSALKDLFYEEVEGVPPISFNGIGENLLDYRIDGNTGGVGERAKNLCPNKNMVVGLYSAGVMIYSNLFITSDFIPVEYGKTYTASLFDLDENRVNNMVYEKINANKEWIGQNSTDKSITINDENIAYLRIRNFAGNSQYITNNNYKYQLEEGSTVTDYEPYGYKVPVVVNGKNLLKINATTQTVNGVTFTVNDDKSITCNGTATGTVAITINTIFSINSTKISGCPMGGSWSSFELDLLNINTNNVDVIDTGNGAVIQNENSYRVRIRIASGYTCNNLTFYPMIRKADIEDDTYEPYIEPTITNIYLDNLIRTVGDEVEYIDYSEQKQHRVRKNLLQNTASRQTINGVTFIVNDDGSVTCNGTANAITQYNINTAVLFNVTEEFILSGCPSSGSESTFLLRGFYIRVPSTVNDNGNGIIIDRINEQMRVQIRIASGYTCDNLTFYPMIRKANIEDDTYEPYIENTEVDVTLPAIPTLDGTNTLTVDTTVQPSNVYIKARKESQYETIMRERYEEAQAQLDALESGGE